MKSADALVLWTPNCAPFLGDRFCGQITVVTNPEPTSTEMLRCSWGASNEGWAQKTDAQRVDELEKLLHKIINRDNIPYATVYAAMQLVEEYKACYT